MIFPPTPLEIRPEKTGLKTLLIVKAYSNNGLFGKDHLNNRCNNLWTLGEKPVKCPRCRLHFPVCSQFALPSTTTKKKWRLFRQRQCFSKDAAKAQDNTSWTEASGNCTCRVSPCRKLTHPEIKVGQLPGRRSHCYKRSRWLWILFQTITKLHTPKQNERLEFLIMEAWF